MAFDLDKALIETYDRVNGDLVPVDMGPVPQPVGDELGLAVVDTECRLQEAKNVAAAILSKKEPCKAFDTCELPEAIKGYIDSEVLRTDSQPIMIVAALLGSLSGMMGKKVMIKEGEYHSDLFPVLWLLNISPSGNFKTTALNSGKKIIDRHDEGFYQEIGAVKERINAIETETGRKKKDIAEDVTRLEAEISKLDGESASLPSSGSIEALIDSLSVSKGGVVFASEFAQWMGSIGKKYNDGGKAYLTEIFDCPKYGPKKHTKSGGITIVERPFFSLTTVSTIEWVKSNIKKDDTASGFFARFLLFYPPQERTKGSALPLYRDKDKSLENAIYFKALSIRERDERLEYKIRGGAKKYYEEVFEYMTAAMDRFGDDEKHILFPFFRRWMPYILKIAALLQPFIDDTEYLSVKALDGAYSVVNYAMRSTVYLYRKELVDGGIDELKEKLKQYLASGKKDELRGWKTKKQILTSRRCDGKDEYNKVLEELMSQGDVTLDRTPKKEMDWVYYLTKDAN